MWFKRRVVPTIRGARADGQSKLRLGMHVLDGLTRQEAKLKTRPHLVATILAAAVVLAGCGGGGATPTKPTKIAIVLGLTNDSFYGTFKCGAAEAAKQLGVNISFQGTTAWGYNLQKPILDAVALQNPDGIGLTPHGYTEANDWITGEIAKGIPVITFDLITTPNVATQGMATDPQLGGAIAAEGLAKLAAQNGAVAVVGIDPGHPNSTRIDGFLNGGGGKPGIKTLRPDLTILPTVWSQNDATKAATGVSAAIQANKNLVAVYTSNGTTAQGAASAIATAGVKDKVGLITWDLFPDFIADVKSGVIKALVGQQPFAMGRMTVENLVGIIRHKIDPASLQKTLKVASIWVTRDNVDDPAIVKQFYTASCG